MAYYYHHQQRSIFGGIVLILIGVVFLLHTFRPDIGIGPLFERFWPLLIVLWGVALLLDHLLASWRGMGRPSAVSGGEIALIIILLLVVAGIAGLDWAHKHSPDIDFGVDGVFDHSYSWKTELSAEPAKLNAAISVVTDRGDITIDPTDDAKLHVNVEKIAQAESKEQARSNADNVQMKITPQNGGFQIAPQIAHAGDFQTSSVRTDLTVLLPAQSPVHVQTNDGDVRVASIHAPVIIQSNRGDLDLHSITGDVNATMSHGDAHIDDVKGSVQLDGRGGEVDLADITGDATIQGEFYGPIRAHNIGQTTRFTSSVSNLTLGRLSGQMEMDSGDFSVSDVNGSVTMTTANKDLTLDEIEGRVELTDRRGDINLRFARAPHDDVRITDQSGNIDVTLPAHSSFTISAVSQNGEVDNDFESAALKSTTSGQSTFLQGTYGTGGPRITLSTTYGTISIHKAE